ncbi:hypothetical protein FHS44_004067 [Streptosporangium saharense]|uniref:Uncharacterized protein n=1 Tax=Streptosporangium saharense TaxID=1706840 RepID=A0A7W7QNP4_9ACTN|nr:hypothetical protein [Streptosporangium saharense]
MPWFRGRHDPSWSASTNHREGVRSGVVPGRTRRDAAVLNARNRGRTLNHLRNSATPQTAPLPAQTLAEIETGCGVLSPQLRTSCGDRGRLRRWSHSKIFYLRTRFPRSEALLRSCGDGSALSTTASRPNLPPTRHTTERRDGETARRRDGETARRRDRTLKHLGISATLQTGPLPAQTSAEMNQVKDHASLQPCAECRDSPVVQRWTRPKPCHLCTCFPRSQPPLQGCRDTKMFQPSPQQPHDRTSPTPRTAGRREENAEPSRQVGKSANSRSTSQNVCRDSRDRQPPISASRHPLPR